MALDLSRNPGAGARLETSGTGDGRFTARGRWTVAGLAAIDSQVRALAPPQRPVQIDLSQLEALDTAGAWLLLRTAKALGASDPGAALVGASDNHALLIKEAAENEPGVLPQPPRVNALEDVLARIGAGLDHILSAGLEMIGFSGLILQTSAGIVVRRRGLRINSVVHNIEAAGLDAVPIISLMSFLVGAVISFMSGDVLNEYGGGIYSVDLISFAFLREFGVLLAAIMVAGRSGSAFTAEIGAMKSHEEIDAMRSLALNPIEILVIPRVVALLVALPILTLISDFMGLIGGGLVDWTTLGITPAIFLNRFYGVTDLSLFNVGMIKAPFFAYLIAMIGCYQGFKVTGTAESVGERTTLSVVQSIFVVIVFDALFAMFFQEINY